MERTPKTATIFPSAERPVRNRTRFIPLGYDFQNGRFDQQVFQFDHTFPSYREEKLAARQESLAKYYPPHQLLPATQQLITNFLIERLIQEHPTLFCLKPTGEQLALQCVLTGEELCLDTKGNYLGMTTARLPAPPYIDAIDALACQLQEDLVILDVREDHNCLTALHLCCPNHWAAIDKIGGDFTAIHRPVPGMDKVSQQSSALLTVLLEKGPFVRFAWGISTDTRLNHHPSPPPDADPDSWHGRAFDPATPQLYLRIERQVLWGFPQHNTLLFTIRTYHEPIDRQHMCKEELAALWKAISGMHAASQEYKGITASKAEILGYLEQLIGQN